MSIDWCGDFVEGNDGTETGCPRRAALWVTLKVGGGVWGLCARHAASRLHRADSSYLEVSREEAIVLDVQET